MGEKGCGVRPASAVSSESTVLGHVTASARFAGVCASHSHHLPLSPQSLLPTSLAFAGLRHKCAPLNTRQRTSCMSRATPCSGPRVAGLTLAVYRSIIPIRTFLVILFCLDRYLACCVLVSIYSPSPGLGQASKYSCSFPFLCICMSAISHLKYHTCYELISMLLKPYRPNTDCIATTCLVLSHLHIYPHTHTHIHTLSPSLYKWQWDNNHTYHPSSGLAHILTLGILLSFYFILSFQTCMQTYTLQYSVHQ